jgi:hypothetical protein
MYPERARGGMAPRGQARTGCDGAGWVICCTFRQESVSRTCWIASGAGSSPAPRDHVLAKLMNATAARQYP